MGGHSILPDSVALLYGRSSKPVSSRSLGWLIGVSRGSYPADMLRDDAVLNTRGQSLTRIKRMVGKEVHIMPV